MVIVIYHWHRKLYTGRKQTLLRNGRDGMPGQKEKARFGRKRFRSQSTPVGVITRRPSEVTLSPFNGRQVVYPSEYLSLYLSFSRKYVLPVLKFSTSEIPSAQ